MRTRRHAAVLLVGFALVLAACGGGSSDAGSSDGASGSGAKSTTTPTSYDSGSGSDSGSDSGSKGGKVDCAEIKTAAQQLLSIQLLAQLNSPENVAAVKDGTIGNYDSAAFLDGMKTLHQLDGYSSPLGDPKAAIDAYEAAAQQAQTLLDADPPTQDALDAYMASIGTTAEFLGHQTAISGAMDAAGC